MRFVGVLMMAAACALPATADTEEAAHRYIGYETFIRYVEAGMVESVTLSRFSEIIGTAQGEDGPLHFRTFLSSNPTDDPLLNRFLDEQGVAVRFVTASDDFITPVPWGFGPGTILVSLGIPLLLVAGIFYGLITLRRILKTQRRILEALATERGNTA